RKHGDVAPIREQPLERDETISMLREVCGQRNWKVFEERGDLDFAYEMDAASRFRCNYLQQAHGYGAVFRLISTKIATLEQLGIPIVAIDFERVSLSLTAAETGLLVFGTLHTNNARKTVDRMVDVFPAARQPQARAMLANSLRGVLAQLLLKKADGSGRVAVNEILVANAAVSAIIREGATQKLQDVIVYGRGQGMQFMDDAIWVLLEKRSEEH